MYFSCTSASGVSSGRLLGETLKQQSDQGQGLNQARQYTDKQLVILSLFNNLFLELPMLTH